jgi:hypothetical protein
MPEDDARCCTPPKDYCLGEGEDITRSSRLCGRGHPSAGPTSGNALVRGPHLKFRLLLQKSAITGGASNELCLIGE